MMVSSYEERYHEDESLFGLLDLNLSFNGSHTLLSHDNSVIGEQIFTEDDYRVMIGTKLGTLDYYFYDSSINNQVVSHLSWNSTNIVKKTFFKSNNSSHYEVTITMPNEIKISLYVSPRIVAARVGNGTNSREIRFELFSNKSDKIRSVEFNDTCFSKDSNVTNKLSIIFPKRTSDIGIKHSVCKNMVEDKEINYSDAISLCNDFFQSDKVRQVFKYVMTELELEIPSLSSFLVSLDYKAFNMMIERIYSSGSFDSYLKDNNIPLQSVDTLIDRNYK